MNNDSTQLNIKRLKYATNLNDYELYRAALEWDLIHPIVIQDKDDLKSEYLWRDKLDPYHHQIKNLITFCRRLPVTLLADDVWLWKTISAGLIMSELASRGRIRKVLIVCPKILMPQWKDELKTKFSITSEIKTGQELINAKLPEWASAVITTYNSARLHLDKLIDENYDMLILDEAHKLRNLHWVEKPPQVAKTFKKALEDRMFKYVLMLTATPIQNRLWDLYSLVDLLTVARGHTNPFGSPWFFAQKYIADNYTDARRLKQENQEEFRSVVYGYMSRIRRWDANLHFPERIVQLHDVEPTYNERELINIVAGSIEKMNRLAQIGILQSLVSSPQALVRRLENMVENGTISSEVVWDIKIIATKIPITTKLNGLGKLIDWLRDERPEDWRVVIFTRFLETQTSIQTFLESKGINCGIINWTTWSSNQEMIAKFSKEIPGIHVIISTEAGSEWVNLQTCNVLVNYDLPWNPMIVEQRIGRIQRLWSNHDKVCIFNIVLRNTFESHIVGRLMEKLQMASHAIWDIDSLLQASGIDDNEEAWADGFEVSILNLVLASLKGKDIEVATQKKEQSIIDARIRLENEEENINSMLWWMDQNESGPMCPQLPIQSNSMDSKSFALNALRNLWAIVKPQINDTYLIEINGNKEVISFDPNNWLDKKENCILYLPGTPAFDKLVWKILVKNLHKIEDIDTNSIIKAEELAKNWTEYFGGIFISSKIEDVCRSFEWNVLLRVRATVAHDSYERLTEITCNTINNFSGLGIGGISPINQEISKSVSIGLDDKDLIEKSKLDPWIMEFTRFYSERMAYELWDTWDDERKRKKIEDDFTARFEFSLVWWEWNIFRQIEATISYGFDNNPHIYASILRIIPSKGTVLNLPKMEECQQTKRTVPEECLDWCNITNTKVLKHLLVASELSNRKALSDYIWECSLTNKKCLIDELDTSAISGKLISKKLLKKSPLSQRIAEFDYFDTCDFTNLEVLKDELSISDISGKKYRSDQELTSNISDKKWHKSEFIKCAVTDQWIIPSESEVCDITWESVTIWILQICETSGKKVLPSELEKSSITGKLALKQYMQSSSISWLRLNENEWVRSLNNLFCTNDETWTCSWSGKNYHPDDLKTCHLTWLTFYIKYMTLESTQRLEVMVKLLDGLNRQADSTLIWEKLKTIAISVFKNKNIKIEASQLSPDGKYLAVWIELKTFLWFIPKYGWFIYSISNDNIIWRIILWKRNKNVWIEE